MEKLFKAVTCVTCQSILSSPVILPCGHSICKYHIPVDAALIRCGKCGLEHAIPAAPDSFPENEALAEIISTNLHKLKLGKAHEQAKTECDIFETSIEFFESVLADPLHHMNEEIAEMRNQVLLKSEELKLKIDQETDKLLGEMSAYMESVKKHLESKEHKDKSNNLESIKTEMRVKLAEHKIRLGELKIDEQLWMKISNELGKERQKLNQTLEDYKSSLRLDSFYQIQHFTNLFGKFDLYSANSSSSTLFPTAISRTRDSIERNHNNIFGEMLKHGLTNKDVLSKSDKNTVRKYPGTNVPIPR